MFSSKDSASQAIGLIADKTVSKAVVNIRGIKTSPNTGSRYLDCEFTLVGGSDNGRKVWSIVMDPTFEGNSDAAKEMGKKFLVRMLEACGLVTVGNEESYRRFSNLQDLIAALSGQTVVIKVGIKKGSDGFGDKNSVTDFLSPNPESGTSERFKQVMSGVTTAPTASPQYSKPSFLGTPAIKNNNNQPF